MTSVGNRIIYSITDPILWKRIAFYVIMIFLVLYIINAVFNDFENGKRICVIWKTAVYAPLILYTFFYYTKVNTLDEIKDVTTGMLLYLLPIALGLSIIGIKEHSRIKHRIKHNGFIGILVFLILISIMELIVEISFGFRNLWHNEKLVSVTLHFTLLTIGLVAPMKLGIREYYNANIRGFYLYVALFAMTSLFSLYFIYNS